MARICNFAEPGSLLKVPRVKDARHLAAIRELPCLVCGRSPSDAAHVRIGHTAETRTQGMGRKPADDQAVPLCHQHHMEEHTGPKTFWGRLGLDPVEIARELYQVSPDITAMKLVLMRVYSTPAFTPPPNKDIPL
jgi:hypothetical protein